MKLWYSFTKELKLSATGFYFYVEIAMAGIFLALLLLVIPENFETKSTEYVYLDVPTQVEESLIDSFIVLDLDQKAEEVEIKSSGDKILVDYYETEDKKIYLTHSEADAIQLADTEKALGAVVSLGDEGVVYDYYLQGYESDKFKNLYKVFHVKDVNSATDALNNQRVEIISENFEGLSDRENVVPMFLTFNGSLMGLFIISAYIFLDKNEGIVTAYAVTASPLWMYLLSKIGVVMVTSTITSLIIVVPVMGLQPNYLMMLLFLFTTGFFISSLGLYLSSFYDNIMQSFGVMYLLIVAMLIPNIAYMMPSWSPGWVKFIPTFYFLQSFKETMLVEGDMMYVLMTSMAFLVLGIAIFFLSNLRFKKTLTI